MTTYVYKNVLADYTRTYAGTEIGPDGVSYTEDKIALNDFVPTYLERYVDGVLSNTNLVRTDLVAPTNQEIAEEQVRLLAAGASYEKFRVDTALTIIGVAATFTTLTAADSVASTSYLQLSSAGAHGLTTGAGHAGKYIYVTWSGGTATSGLYAIKTVDDANIITLNTPSLGFAGMGTAVVSKVTVAIPMYTATIPAGLLGTNGELVMDSLWSHTSSANSKTITTKLDSTTFGAYVTPTTVGSTALRKTIINKAAAVQISSAGISSGSGSSAAAITTGTVDTAVATTLTVLGTLATADEVLTLELFSCKVEK